MKKPSYPLYFYSIALIAIGVFGLTSAPAQANVFCSIVITFGIGSCITAYIRDRDAN